MGGTLCCGAEGQGSRSTQGAGVARAGGPGLGSLPCVREPGQGEADGFRQMGGTWDSLGKRGRTWVLSGCKCLVSMWPSGCPWMSGCLWVSGHQRGCGCQGASVAMRASVAMGARVAVRIRVSGCQRGHGSAPTPVLLPGEFQGWGSLVGCGLPGSPEGNTEGPGTASSEPLLPS